jgi:hypothetical protein
MVSIGPAKVPRDPGTPEADRVLSGYSGLLGEFNEDAVGRLGMDERNAATTSASARLLVDEGVALFATGRECGVEVGHPVAYVVDSRPPAGQETTDRRIRIGRFEQFDLRAAEVKMDDAGTIDLFRGTRRHPEHVTVEAQRGIDVLDRNADVCNGGIHDGNI